MIATKEQERKALEKIRKIVDELGEDSYLATAFEGCFEDAEENIENDFACSWKQRAKSLLDQLAKETERCRHATAEANGLREKVKALEAKQIPAEDLNTCYAVLLAKKNEVEAEMKKAGAEIIEWSLQPEAPEFQKATETYHGNKRLLNRYEEMIAHFAAVIR